MKTPVGEMLNERERRCLWSPDELAALYDDALGNYEIWDDVLDAARATRRVGFADTVGQSETLSSVGSAPRLGAPTDQPIAYLEVLGDGGTARQVALLAQLRQQLEGSTILAAVPEQLDLETLRSLRRAGADVCVCGGRSETTEPVALQSLLDAQNAAFAAGFTRLGLTATIGADARSQLAFVLLQSNHLMEELGLHPHTIAVRRDPSGPPAGVAAGLLRDPFPLQIALLRVAHPYSNIEILADTEPDLILRQLDIGANLVRGPVPPTAATEGFRFVAEADIEPGLRELSYRRLASMDHAGGLISEFRTKSTQTYMLVRRPAGPGALGNNLHRGLYRSKDPETVVLIEGSLSITSRHPDRPEPMVAVITSTPQAPHKLTIPRNVYHEVVAKADSLLIEFSSHAEDTTDSFPWPLSST
jgi:hypothetical protein